MENTQIQTNSQSFSQKYSISNHKKKKKNPFKKKKKLN